MIPSGLPRQCPCSPDIDNHLQESGTIHNTPNARTPSPTAPDDLSLPRKIAPPDDHNKNNNFVSRINPINSE